MYLKALLLKKSHDPFTTPDFWNIFTEGQLELRAPLQWAFSGPISPAAPTDDTVGTAGNISRPYSWG